MAEIGRANLDKHRELDAEYQRRIAEGGKKASGTQSGCPRHSRTPRMFSWQVAAGLAAGHAAGRADCRRRRIRSKTEH